LQDSHDAFELILKYRGMNAVHFRQSTTVGDLGNIFSVFGLSVMTMSDWAPLFAIANNGNPYNKRVWRENEGVYGGMPGFV